MQTELLHFSATILLTTLRGESLGSTGTISVDADGNWYAGTTTSMVCLKDGKWIAVGSTAIPGMLDSTWFDKDGALWALTGDEIYVLAKAPKTSGSS